MSNKEKNNCPLFATTAITEHSESLKTGLDQPKLIQKLNDKTPSSPPHNKKDAHIKDTHTKFHSFPHDDEPVGEVSEPEVEREGDERERRRRELQQGRQSAERRQSDAVPQRHLRAKSQRDHVLLKDGMFSAKLTFPLFYKR